MIDIIIVMRPSFKTRNMCVRACVPGCVCVRVLVASCSANFV